MSAYDGISALENEAIQAIEAATSTAQLREIELKYLGKSGLISGLMRGIGALPNEEKPQYGAAVNGARARVEELRRAWLQDL